MLLSNAPTRFMSEAQASVVFGFAPRQVFESSVALACGSTVKSVLAASGVLAQFPDLLAELAAGQCTVGIWSRRVDVAAAVRAGDRVEIYRQLLKDPKIARRERFKRQGIQRAGLFAKSKKNTGK